MKKMILTTLAVLMTFGLASLLPEDASAQERGKRHKGSSDFGMLAPGALEKMADELELTEQQRSQIRTIFEGARQEGEPLRQRVRTENQALRQLLSADSVDQRQVMRKLEEVLEAESAMKRHRMQLLLNAQEVLTPAQRARARELRSNHRKKGGERMRERR